jgi:hypothetical protein
MTLDHIIGLASVSARRVLHIVSIFYIYCGRILLYYHCMRWFFSSFTAEKGFFIPCIAGSLARSIIYDFFLFHCGRRFFTPSRSIKIHGISNKIECICYFMSSTHSSRRTISVSLNIVILINI